MSPNISAKVLHDLEKLDPEEAQALEEELQDQELQIELLAHDEYEFVFGGDEEE